MHLKKKMLAALAALVFAAVALTALTAAVLSSQQNIPATGNIVAVNQDGPTQGPSQTVSLEIYSDAATTVPCTNLSWGNVNAGEASIKTLYLKNTGNTPLVLNMTVTQWSPVSAGNVLSLVWNKEGSTLAAGAVAVATITLQVPANPGTLQAFGLNIVISGTAQ